MASILLALATSPETSAGRRALALAQSLADQGHALTLWCLQDAAFLASARVPAAAQATLDRLRDRGARWVVLAGELALRGVEAGAHATALDHAGLTALLTAGHDRVIGAL